MIFSEKAIQFSCNVDTEVFPVSETKFAAITIDVGMGKGSAFRASFISKLFPVSETKFAVITIDGGMGKGSAFRASFISKLFPVSETKFAVITIDGGMGKGSAFLIIIDLSCYGIRRFSVCWQALSDSVLTCPFSLCGICAVLP